MTIYRRFFTEIGQHSGKGFFYLYMYERFPFLALMSSPADPKNNAAGSAAFSAPRGPAAAFAPKCKKQPFADSPQRAAPKITSANQTVTFS